MVTYLETKENFCKDVINGRIGEKIVQKLNDKGIEHSNESEFNSWENSLKCMMHILNHDTFSNDIQIAIEYQVPQTSKRVDFMIAGCDDEGNKNIIIVELKQWETAKHTNTDGIVKTFTGRATRCVTHPSYQAYSYAKMIENFNTVIQNENIGVIPCAYLHNFNPDFLSELSNSIYDEITSISPFFIKGEEEKFRSYIGKYVKKASEIDILTKVDKSDLHPAKALQDSIVKMLNGTKEFIMIDEQKIVYEAVKNLIDISYNNDEKSTIIIEGGPGTGKSVVAIQLLADLTANNKISAAYVTKNSAPRNVYFEKLRQGNAKWDYINNLFKGSGSFYDCEKEKYVCLISDESHRLNERSGLRSNKGENQIKEIINSSKVSVFFIDEDQRVTAKDIGSVNEIKKWAELLGRKVYFGEQYNLASQFRCNGSDGYIAFLNDVLGIKKTANYNGFDGSYEICVFDNPNEMREELRKKNEINNKSRMLAGYCYEWISKNNNSVYDINLKNGFSAQWNFSNTGTWAIDAQSFEQVGCIHTSQGLEFDYVGVIIGNDLRYENDCVITDPSMRAKSDYSLRGLKKNNSYFKDADIIIRNTYKTLLTRGQKGCYIYCEDEALNDFLKKRIYI